MSEHCPGCRGIVADTSTSVVRMDHPDPMCPGMVVKCIETLACFQAENAHLREQLAEAQALLDKRARVRVSCHDVYLRERARREDAEAQLAAVTREKAELNGRPGSEVP
jgi:hypothetical protein